MGHVLSGEGIRRNACPGAWTPKAGSTRPAHCQGNPSGLVLWEYEPMLGNSWKSLLVVGVVAATLGVAVSQADACWGCGGYYPTTWSYAAYYSPSYSSCYSCYTPCTVGCDPCYASSGGWYVGYRPGPIRRLLLGPYRWYYGGDYGYVSSCYTATCCGSVETSYAPMQAAPMQAAPMQAAPTEAPLPAQEPPAVARPALDAHVTAARAGGRSAGRRPGCSAGGPESRRATDQRAADDLCALRRKGRGQRAAHQERRKPATVRLLRA